MSFTPSLEEVISLAIEDKLLDVHTSIPAIVQSYDPATQTASVKIAIKRKYIIGDLEEIAERPAIPDVPVLFPTGGSFSLTYPLKPGDDVHLLISERSTEVWKNNSGVVDPKDARKFSLSDCFIIPAGARKVISEATSDKLRVVSGNGFLEMNENGQIRIVNTSGFLHINQNGEIIVQSNGQRVFLKNNKSSVEIKTGGDVEVKTTTGTLLVTDDGKFKFQGAEELMTLLIDLVTQLQSAQVMTALGPQNILPPVIGNLATIKSKLTSIKG